MNDLEYLRKISQTNRVAAKKESGGGGLMDIFKTKLFKIAMVGLALLIFIIILGSIVGQSSNKGKDALVRVNMRVANLASVVTNYNYSVKSSKLRAMGSSLSNILSDTSRDVYTILQTDYNYDESAVNEEMMSEETERLTEVQSTLERAKMNGILDRTYLHQLIYEVASLMSLESEAMARMDNAGAKQVLQNSIDSLNVLHEQLSNYSDSTN